MNVAATVRVRFADFASQSLDVPPQPLGTVQQQHQPGPVYPSRTSELTVSNLQHFGHPTQKPRHQTNPVLLNEPGVRTVNSLILVAPPTTTTAAPAQSSVSVGLLAGVAAAAVAVGAAAMLGMRAWRRPKQEQECTEHHEESIFLPSLGSEDQLIE